MNHLRSAIVVIVIALSATVSSCTFKGAEDATYLTDKRYPPKPANAPIEIISGEPDRSYILIGEVSAWADVDMLEGAKAQNAIDKIKAQARQMGGDAIIRYDGHRAPAGTVGAGGFTAQGNVVRWE